MTIAAPAVRDTVTYSNTEGFTYMQIQIETVGATSSISFFLSLDENTTWFSVSAFRLDNQQFESTTALTVGVPRVFVLPLGILSGARFEKTLGTGASVTIIGRAVRDDVGIMGFIEGIAAGGTVTTLGDADLTPDNRVIRAHDSPVDAVSIDVQVSTIDLTDIGTFNVVASVNVIANAARNTWYGNTALQSTSAVAGTGSATTGVDNTAFGNAAGALVSTGANNTAVGASALPAASIGGRNTAVGFEALRVATASSNVAVGYQALTDLVGGVENVAVGTLAGSLLAGSESHNLFLGPNVVGTLGDVARAQIGTRPLDTPLPVNPIHAISLPPWRVRQEPESLTLTASDSTAMTFAAHISKEIILVSVMAGAGAVNWTLPVASTVVSSFGTSTAKVGDCFDFSIQNQSATGVEDITLLPPGDGSATIEGHVVIYSAINTSPTQVSSALFRIRLGNVGGGTEAYVCYRLS